MLIIKSVQQAQKMLNLSSQFFGASAWLDGYEGNDRSGNFGDKSERQFYDHWWLLGAEFKTKETEQ